jgi:hypothetical protein
VKEVIGVQAICSYDPGQPVSNNPPGRVGQKERNTPETKLVVTPREDFERAMDFSAVCMIGIIRADKSESMVYATHLADLWVIPPRLAGQ